ESREWQRWRALVASVLDDVTDPDECFRILHAHFAQPTAWRCEPGTAETIRSLRQAGYVVGMASNFDHRLHQVAAGLPDLAGLDHVVVSSKVGWKKPSRQFF